MKVGIMQPYFFPYVGYFSLIAATDNWVIFDTAQYIRHGWINRNRILKPCRKDWQYIKVPLKKHSRNTTIKDIEISEKIKWKEKIIAQLYHYKHIAPYYSNTIELVQTCLSIEHKYLSNLNTTILVTICDFLGIKINYEIFSQMDLEIDKVKHPGEWALNISKAMKANMYINPSGGKELFIPNEFKKANIDLLFLANHLPNYHQHNENFISGLSIIDVLMFNSPEETLKFIKNYALTAN